MKAYGCLPCAFSGKNRSGSYNSGFGKYLGSRWMNKVKMETEDPAGMIDPLIFVSLLIFLPKKGTLGNKRSVSLIQHSRYFIFAQISHCSRAIRVSKNFIELF